MYFRTDIIFGPALFILSITGQVLGITTGITYLTYRKLMKNGKASFEKERRWNPQSVPENKQTQMIADYISSSFVERPLIINGNTVPRKTSVCSSEDTTISSN